MSASAVKLSPAIKALISAPHARGSALPCPDPSRLNSLFDTIRSRGQSSGVTQPSWLTLSTAAIVTVNSPATLCHLYSYAEQRNSGLEQKVEAAAVMRETALKCISFSGIPRTINALTALRAHLPAEVTDKLDTKPHRNYTPENIEASNARGKGLWDAIYEPHSVKLLQKLADAHPDLPVHILTSHYSNVLSDPFGTSPDGGFKIGRILTSVVAMACLRAQTGVSPQLTSHVFGLKKALLEGGGVDGEAALPGQEWLTSDEGVEWILQSTDAISDLVGGGQVSFGGQMRREAKL